MQGMLKNIVIVLLIGALSFQYWLSHQKVRFDEKLFKQVLEERFKNTVNDDPFNPYICLSNMQQRFENDALEKMGVLPARSQFNAKDWARLNVISDAIHQEKHKIVEDQIKQRAEKNR